MSNDLVESSDQEDNEQGKLRVQQCEQLLTSVAATEDDYPDNLEQSNATEASLTVYKKYIVDSLELPAPQKQTVRKALEEYGWPTVW
jgi:hypothetical protein